MKNSQFWTISAISVLIWASIAGKGQAQVITQSPDLNPGNQYRLVFITQGVRNATSSNIGDYNNFVTAQAMMVPELAALNTTWRAMVSTATVDAIDNTNLHLSPPTFDLLGRKVNEISIYQNTGGGPQRFMNITQFGNTLNTEVWTGTGTDGLGPGLAPVQFGGGPQVLGGGPSVLYGLSNHTDIPWTSFANADASGLRSFYVISGTLVAVPEPSSLLLAALAGAAFTLRIRRRIRLRSPN